MFCVLGLLKCNPKGPWIIQLVLLLQDTFWVISGSGNLQPCTSSLRLVLFLHACGVSQVNSVWHWRCTVEKLLLLVSFHDKGHEIGYTLWQFPHWKWESINSMKFFFLLSFRQSANLLGLHIFFSIWASKFIKGDEVLEFLFCLIWPQGDMQSSILFLFCVYKMRYVIIC